jgi:hypothetical protein
MEGTGMADRILARSQRYVISHEYEVVFLEREGRKDVIIGDFYGDPECAIIDRDERWCLMAGCGLIMYQLRAPFQPYTYDTVSDQWVELFRSPPDCLWIEALYQTGKDTVRLVVDVYSQQAGIYELSLGNLTLTQLFSNPPLPEDG